MSVCRKNTEREFGSEPFPAGQCPDCSHLIMLHIGCENGCPACRMEALMKAVERQMGQWSLGH